MIGRSHDDRMIPMLEIGKGDTCIICLSGVESGDRNLPEYLLSIAKDYCSSIKPLVIAIPRPVPDIL